MTETKVLARAQVKLVTRSDEDAPSGFAFTGYAVPFNETYARYWEDERFDPSCIFDGMDSAKIAYEHGGTVGRVEAWRTDDNGLEIDGLISQTSLGRDVATLMRDGVLDRLSIGFVGLEHRVMTDETTGRETVVWLRVRIYEVSLVAAPAYEGAELTEVRSQHKGGTPMGDENKTDQMMTRSEFQAALAEALAPVGEQVREVRSSLAAISTKNEPASPQFRTYGEFVKAYHRQDEAALALMSDYSAAARDVTLNNRAYDGAAIKDAISRAPFVGNAIALASENRTVLNSFTTAPMPETGMSVDYGVLEQNTVAVAQQKKEGDTLTKGKISLKPASADVETYGGYSEVSFQVIERASEDYLDILHEAQVIEYGKQTELRVRKLLAETSAANLADGHKLGQVVNPQATDWVAIIVDAVQMYDSLGLPLNGMFLTADKFKELVTLADDNKRLQFTVSGTGSNSVGTLNTPELEAILPGGLRARLRPAAADAQGAGEFYTSRAIKTWESAGAPMTLQDKTGTNLTQSYSVYGYLATGAQMPKGILPIEFATA